jgi:hypothetical protein
MKLDRKFLLIAPSLVLAVIVAGMFYTTTRLRQVVEASDNWQMRSDYVASIERGERKITNAKAVQLVRLSLEAERRRTAAIDAARDLLLTLVAMTLACCFALLWTIRGVPRTLPLRGPVLFRTSP